MIINWTKEKEKQVQEAKEKEFGTLLKLTREEIFERAKKRLQNYSDIELMRFLQM